MNQEIYQQKYLKYKKKYLELKLSIGGNKEEYINDFQKAQNSNDLEKILDKIMNIKNQITETDIKTIVKNATTTKDRLTYSVWNKDIRKKMYILLETLRRQQKPSSNNVEIYDLKTENDNEDKDIEEKMGNIDTDEETFVKKINKFTDFTDNIKNNVQNIVTDVTKSTKNLIPRQQIVDLNNTFK
jgi:hypothetical protein